jgi:xanthine dehydrogenase small subunit
MAAVPKRAAAAERAALGRAPGPETGAVAADTLPRDLAPIDDVRSTAAYRMRVAGNLVRELLAENLGALLDS